MFWRSNILPASQLYDQTNFYRAFESDLSNARRRVVIESPFIASRRFYALLPVLQKALSSGVTIVVNTRDPSEHEPHMRAHAEKCIEVLHDIGVTVLYTGALHRKIAFIDDVVYEGSLNILSQSDSCEIMRRTKSSDYTCELIKFIKLSKWYN